MFNAFFLYSSLHIASCWDSTAHLQVVLSYYCTVAARSKCLALLSASFVVPMNGRNRAVMMKLFAALACGLIAPLGILTSQSSESIKILKYDFSPGWQYQAHLTTCHLQEIVFPSLLCNYITIRAKHSRSCVSLMRCTALY